METPAEGSPSARKRKEAAVALYHFTISIKSRSNGDSACATAAYCSGEKILNEYDGLEHDYRRKRYIEHTVILLPDNAPVKYKDRQALWNAVEAYEKQTNAQLARSIEFSLPRELDESIREQIALEYIQENFVNDGMIADVCFHNPPMMDSHRRPLDHDGNPTYDPREYKYNNPHVHVLLTLRPIGSDGNWEAKKQKLYVCEKDGLQKTCTAQELKDSPGWEKLYNYTDTAGHRSWHTKSYASKHPELTQVNRYPKCEQMRNPKVERWNSPETLIAWRAAWSNKVNMTFEKLGMTERIDHRSYSEQGLDLIPTVHEGKAVTITERRLKEEYDRRIANGEEVTLQHTEIRSLNIAIREHNTRIRMIRDLRKLREQLDQLIDKAKERMTYISQSLAERLERLRAAMIVIRILIHRTSVAKDEAQEKLNITEDYMKSCDIQPLESLLSRRDSLKKKYEHTHQRSIMEELEYLEAEISIREEDASFRAISEKEIISLRNLIKKAADKIRSLQEKFRRLEKEYRSFNISPEMDAYCQHIRPEIEAEYSKKVGKVSFDQEAKETDEILRIQCSKPAPELTRNIHMQH